MNRTLFLVVLLLACLALPLGHLAAQDVAAPASCPCGEVEPNDTPAQATPVPLGAHIYGAVGGADAIDYFSFTAQAGDKIAVTEHESYYLFWADVTLYQPDMTPVPLNEPSRWATLPVSGVYTLGVTGGGYDGGYSLYLTLLTGTEPNESMATATPATIGQVVVATVDYPCDEDWFRFEGRAGDVFPDYTRESWDDIALLDAAGHYLSGFMLPSDGVYYLRVYGWWYDDYEGGDYCYLPDDYQEFTLGRSPWISAAVDGLGGNPAIKAADIVTRRTAGGWQLVFDASDVGITKNVNAIDVLDDGSILMSLQAAQNVPGLGKVQPQDIIRFTPTSLGDTTAGSFAWFLDGSDVGLTTAGESIDAIDMQEWFDTPLRISLVGGGSVPRRAGGMLKVADEDVINFVQTQFGANSAGLWRNSLDGSRFTGMAAEDVNALGEIAVWPPRLSVDLLVMGSAFNIGGVRGGPKDLFVLGDGLWQAGFADKAIDALTIGAAED